jgi:hypothetical protein
MDVGKVPVKSYARVSPMTVRDHFRPRVLPELGPVSLDSVAKLQIGLQRFFREKSNQATIADRRVLKRATEVAGEFITSCCGPPARLFDRRAYSPENLSSVIQKEFCNTIPSTADFSAVSVQFGSGPGAAIVDTIDEGHSLSEHANPLRSVHANRASGATS